MNAPLAKEAESVGAAEKAGERETSASGQLTGPEACSVETAKSTGARETNVPEERSAAVRRDGEPLANAAKRRRQREAATDEQQVATGEQPSSPVGEELEAAPPLVEDPADWLQGAADADQQQSAATEAGHGEAAHKNSESIRRFEEILRQEAREMLTGYLRDGTDYLSASTVRRVVQVAGMSVVGRQWPSSGWTERYVGSQQHTQTRTRLHWLTTWYGCGRRSCWTGCGRGPSTQVRTRIRIQQGAQWVRDWSRIWRKP